MKLPAGVVRMPLSPLGAGPWACVLPVNAMMARAPPRAQVATILFISVFLSGGRNYIVLQGSFRGFRVKRIVYRSGRDARRGRTRLTGGFHENLQRAYPNLPS